MPAHVQQASGNDSNGTTGGATASLGSDTTSGNFLIAIVSLTIDDQADNVTLSDNKSNTWVKKYDQVDPDSFGRILVFIAHNITGGASHTVTSAGCGGNRNAIVVIEASGMDTTQAYDRFAENLNQFTTTPTSGNTQTLREADELVVGVGFQTTSNTPTVGSGYSNFVIAQDVSGKLCVQSKVVAATDAVASSMANFQSNAASFQAVFTFSETEIPEPVDTSDEREMHVHGKAAASAEREVVVFGGDGRYLEDFSTTTFRDGGNTDAKWDGDGVLEMSPN